MTDTYQSLKEKPFESHYVYVDAILDEPVEKVWPHAVHIGKWMNDHKLQTVAGEPGSVGHFEKVLPQGFDHLPTPRHHFYGTAYLVPFKCISLEVFPEKGGSYGSPSEWRMFDHILLTDLGGKTKIAFLMQEVHPGAAGAEPRKLGEEEQMRERSLKYFENLIDLVRGGR
jgi:hypothetical protein